MKHPARPQVYSILLSVLLLAACSNPKKTIPEEELAAPPSPENSAVASADSGKPDANPQYLQQEVLALQPDRRQSVIAHEGASMALSPPIADRVYPPHVETNRERYGKISDNPVKLVACRIPPDCKPA
ncbi:MAG: hypothetical protein LBE06_12490 [Azoarcus sp.]|jgi:hypothetical protein|nr:hypothetical protein [Azoarcus sp.]